MRACMVAYSHYESDNRVRRYAESLAGAGWQVDAIVLRREGQEKKDTIRGVNVFRIQKRVPDEKSKLAYFIRIFRFLVNSGVLLALRQVSRRRYDIIHIHSIPDYEVFAALIPKLLGAKVILDIHDIVPELFSAKFGVSEQSILFRTLVIMERLSARIADHVVIANHIWHERIVSRSVSSDKCSVILNYPDEAIFGEVVKTRSDDEVIMLYPGTLSKHQGIELVLEALHRIRQDVPKLRFHIQGSGTDEMPLKQLTVKLGLQDVVRFSPPVSLEQIAQTMANADIGVEPKRSDGFSDEAFSTKILEFMLLGVPVIVSDTSVHTYYIDDGLARYFKAGDIDDLAVAIRHMYDDQNARDAIRVRAGRFVKEMCWDVRKNEYFSILEKLSSQFRFS